ncbi:DUF6351 family protein [Nocardioides acrostichi]|uniref:DUF6351 domain-containing protein n=1 Tax=Nocardioides acrostichi TaxID=2784339 RepID=A0A930V524_9ACTN|nr:DUF6351 family protein [Nocardioides acrostichi]MBF4163890.1 hypothetical protein [Nocardioides acrostichi]
MGIAVKHVTSHLGVALLAALVAAGLASAPGLTPSADGATPGASSAAGSSEAVTAHVTGQRRLTLRVLSNRADLISGGDALVRVTLPHGATVRRLHVRAGHRDVSHRFERRPDGTISGLVKGLPVGRTVLRARVGGHRAHVALVNHRQGGPVFSGPQTRHYVCQDTATNARCDQPPTYTFLYRSSDPAQLSLQPYDPDDPPSDVATTTTQSGDEVPFIVRREDGFQDRDRYSILTLFTPGKRWRAWAPQPQWNHKLLVTHGGGCGASYTPGTPPLDDYSGTFSAADADTVQSYVHALGEGFAVLSTALDNTGHNCSVAMNAESVMMAKERLVEQYGTLRYTIGTGCSGGSIAQHTVANAYPGIYQGLVTTCSYPDVFTAGAQFADYHLMRLYFEDPTRWAPGVVWSPTQMAQVEGHLSIANSITADEGLFKNALDPQYACPGTQETVAGDPSTRYEPDTNPGGVRCSVLDLLVNQLGRRPRSTWTPAEQTAGHGFGGIPFANTGVMFGLHELESGAITPAQFVDLNTQLGGIDVDLRPTPDRISGDARSIRYAYRTGLVNEFDHTSQVPIINFGGPDPGAAHDYAHAFWTDERIEAAQGNADNRVMWFGPTPLIGDPAWANEALDSMDAWLSAIEADHSSTSLATKVVADKPADITDRCVVAEAEQACSTEQLQVLQTRLSTPRQEAGGPLANDIVACRLRPFTDADVAGSPVPFTAEQLAALHDLYADGVCDWSRPGRGQHAATTWLRYDARGGGVQYGGRPLPDAPARSGGGLTSTSWHGMGG